MARTVTREIPAWRRAAARAANPGLASILVAIAAFAWLWFVVSPATRHTNDTDATATVLYFERIVHGQRLEAFFPTTPKPLLTLIYGLAWTLTGDWRSLTILTMTAGAAAAGMLARLTGRLAGPAAAIVAVVALLAWPSFQLEVAGANSFVWGLALWLAAALLITAQRPHPWLAGIALALAGLARTETVWLLGAVTLCLGVAALLAARRHEAADLRLGLPLLLGWAAIPLACLHDVLLAGQPLYWLGVPAGYTALTYPDLAAQPPLEMIKHELAHYRGAIVPLVLAAAGLGWLALSRRRALGFATFSLAGGVLATLVVLAWRAIYISPRYYEEADAAILFLAAIGLGKLLALPFDLPRLRLGGRLASLAPPVLGAVLIGATVVAVVPKGTIDAPTQSLGSSYAALETQMPALETLLAGARGDTVAVAGVGYPVSDPAGCRVFVPRVFVPTVSIEAGVPLTAIGDSFLAFRDRDYSELQPGQWVLHIASADGASGPYAPFERSRAGALALGGRSVWLVPVVADPAAGVWLIRVDALGLA